MPTSALTRPSSPLHTRPRVVSFLFVIVVAAAELSHDVRGAYANYPPEPTVIEYVVDPAWPKRSAELGPRGPVPGIAIDRENRVWCVERGEVPVQVYSASGELVRSWGRGEFKSVHNIRLDGQGNVWITDFEAHVVKKFTPEGKLLLTLGTPGERGEDETHFNRPTDTAITPSGDIFVSDGYGNRRVVHFNAQGKFVKTWGTFGSGPGQFSLPHMIALDSRGVLYVADRNSGRIQLFDQKGRFLNEWSNLIMPWGLCMTAQDELWVCGSSPQWWRLDGQYPPPKNQLFMRFSLDGRIQQVWGVPIGLDGQDTKPGECNWVHGMALDAQGNIYAGDIVGKRLQKFVRVVSPRPEPAPKASKKK